MRISHKYKFIFLSRWKCASEAIRHCLDAYSDIVSSQEYPYYHHTTALKLKEHFLSQGWNWDDYYVFLSIRNPWEMLVSLYCYGMPDADGKYYWDRHWEDISKYQFHPDQRCVPHNAIGFKQWLTTYDLTRFTYEAFAYDADGKDLTQDFVKVENLDDDLHRVLTHVGSAAPKSALPHTNRTVHSDPSHYFDEELNAIVARIFAKDIALGGYSAPAAAQAPQESRYPLLTKQELELLHHNERKYSLKKYWTLQKRLRNML